MSILSFTGNCSSTSHTAIEIADDGKKDDLPSRTRLASAAAAEGQARSHALLPTYPHLTSDERLHVIEGIQRS